MSAHTKGKKLSPRWEAFCQQLLIDTNITKAATVAGFSKRTAHSQGSRLFKNVKIQARLAELREKRSMRTMITQDRILEELARVGFSTMGNYARVNEDGVPVMDFSRVGDDQWAAIQQLETEELVTADKVIDEGDPDDDQVLTRQVKTVKVKFKLYDKVNSLIKLGIQQGLSFGQKIEVTGKDGKPIESETTYKVDLSDPLAKRDLARRIAFLLKPGIEAAKAKGKIK